MVIAILATLTKKYWLIISERWKLPDNIRRIVLSPDSYLNNSNVNLSNQAKLNLINKWQSLHKMI